MKTTHAQLKIKRGKTIITEIPTDEEIERIAVRMHKTGKPCLETILGCKVFYRPRMQGTMTITNIDPFTGEKGTPSEPYKTSTWAEFTFGYEGPWQIVLLWQAGDDKPPERDRDEDKR